VDRNTCGPSRSRSRPRSSGCDSMPLRPFHMTAVTITWVPAIEPAGRLA
jgi:hypothetical protein